MPQFFISDNGNETIHYNYPSYSGYVSRGRLSYCPDYRFPSHWHNDLEFSVVLEGQMEYSIDGHIETVRQGQGIFINSRHLHSNYSPDHRDCEYVCVLAHPMVLCVQPGMEREFVAPLVEDQGLPYVLLTGEQPWHRDILQGLLDIYAARDHAAAPLLFQSQLCRIWAQLFSNVDREQPPVSDSEDLTCVKAMVAYVQENCRNRLTLAQIAAAGAVGQSKCCKLFGRYLAMTPNAYLNQCRLERSRELLLGSSLPISEIAGAVGYSGASYFAESFRKWYGMTPTEYRRQMGV